MLWQGVINMARELARNTRITVDLGNAALYRSVKVLSAYQGRPLRDIVAEALVGLETNPRPQDVRRLHGVERGYRVDSGEYRIIYEIDDAERRVVVRVVKHRKDVYRNL
jgi:mRNA interferase RelE/StbE